MEMTNKKGGAEYTSPVFNSVSVSQQCNICYSEPQNAKAYPFDSFVEEDDNQQLNF